MDYKFEANIIRSLGKIIEKGHLNRGDKPVHWCLDCKSALAEAEVEYQDKTSTSIDFIFPIENTLVEGIFNSSSFLVVLNSYTPHRECRGSIILFLKLQVRINRQLFANSSMNPRNAV